MNHLFLPSLITLVAISPIVKQTAGAQNLLSIKESISDTTIVYPESFETDTKKMMENWYLQNYIVLNDKFSTSTADESDEAYIGRLAAIPTTIEMPYNQIVRQYINMYTQRRRQLVENMLGMSLYYLPIFESALERHGVPLELRYLPVIESAMNPDAVSRVGATGLWQFMLPTARGLGLEINTLVDERRDPYASSEAAAKYLKQLYSMYNDWSLAIAAYNCGPGNVNKALRRAGTDKADFWSIYYYLPQETRGYVPAFIAANYVMTYYNLHGISPALARRPIVTDSVHVNKRIHFNQIAEVLNMPVEEIRVLNPQYRHDLIPGNQHPYPLVLPSMQIHSFIMSQDSIVNHRTDIYGRRLKVEPTMTVAGTSGEYTTKLVVKTHVVKKNETFTSIARKYGVTVNEIKSWNKIKKKTKTLQRGRRLKIHTYERIPVVKPTETVKEENPAPAPEPQTEVTDSATTQLSDTPVESPAETHEQPADNDSTPTVMPFSGLDEETAISNNTDSTSVATPEPKPKTPDKAFAPKHDNTSSKKATSKTKKTVPPQAATYKVRKGDTLSKIAKRYGTTVAKIKKANNMSSDNLSVGKKIKIPQK